MIVEATARDFALLKQGQAREGLRMGAEVELAPPAVLEMLAGLAQTIAEQFRPSAWMLVEDREVVGLMSLTRPPVQGEIHIGYGVAPARQGRGTATRAVADLLAWARQNERVDRVSADTAVDNVASQRVLERNGFVRIGDRIDAEDGPLICWQATTA